MPNDEPVSSSAIFDPSVASRYRGGVTAYRNPMYIADAALYLRHHQPDLGIDDIYELDQRQFSAAVALLREQRQNNWSLLDDLSSERQGLCGSHLRRAGMAGDDHTRSSSTG